MINWIPATPENVKKYFKDDTYVSPRNKKSKFVFLTERNTVLNYADCIQDGYLICGRLGVTHFALRCDFDKILPKGDL